MKKIALIAIATVMLCSCSNITPQQKEQIVDLIIAGINVAEQVYLADAQTPKDKDFTLTDVDSNNNIEYQLMIAYKLLKQNGKKYAMKETKESYELTLKHFVVRLVEHKSKGEATTKLCIKRATVKDGVITDLMYSLEQEDGTRIEEECPSCVDWLVE